MMLHSASLHRQSPRSHTPNLAEVQATCSVRRADYRAISHHAAAEAAMTDAASRSPQLHNFPSDRPLFQYTSPDYCLNDGASNTSSPIPFQTSITCLHEAEDSDSYLERGWLDQTTGCYDFSKVFCRACGGGPVPPHFVATFQSERAFERWRGAMGDEFREERVGWIQEGLKRRMMLEHGRKANGDEDVDMDADIPSMFMTSEEDEEANEKGGGDVDMNIDADDSGSSEEQQEIDLETAAAAIDASGIFPRGPPKNLSWDELTMQTLSEPNEQSSPTEFLAFGKAPSAHDMATDARKHIAKVRFSSTRVERARVAAITRLRDAQNRTTGQEAPYMTDSKIAKLKAYKRERKAKLIAGLSIDPDLAARADERSLEYWVSLAQEYCWVETQRAQYEAQRLSSEQLAYLGSQGADVDMGGFGSPVPADQWPFRQETYGYDGQGLPYPVSDGIDQIPMPQVVGTAGPGYGYGFNFNQLADQPVSADELYDNLGSLTWDNSAL